MELRWAVLRSQAHRETLAARSVSARGLESYVPWLPTRPGSKTTQPLFPGYLFARVAPDSDDLLRIRSVPGVAYVLPRAGPPSLLPDPLIDAIRSHEQTVFESRAPHFRHGDAVRVVSGPFKWVEGLFDRSLNASGRVRILLQMVHGSVAVQLEAAELEVTQTVLRKDAPAA